MLTDGNGIPLGITTSGANTHDKRLVEATLESIPIDRPEPTRNEPQHMCMDKGYDYVDIRALIEEWGFTAHIKSRGQEEQERKEIPGYRARRWVVERTLAWLNRHRRLAKDFEASIASATAWIYIASMQLLVRRIA